MQKVEEFYTSAEEEHCKIAVEVIGLQPDHDQLVWVMDKNIHLDKHGVALNRSPFYWIEGHNAISQSIACTTLVATIPEGVLALTKLVECLENVYGQNFAASLMMLGTQV